MASPEEEPLAGVEGSLAAAAVTFTMLVHMANSGHERMRAKIMDLIRCDLTRGTNMFQFFLKLCQHIAHACMHACATLLCRVFVLAISRVHSFGTSATFTFKPVDESGMHDVTVSCKSEGAPQRGGIRSAMTGVNTVLRYACQTPTGVCQVWKALGFVSMEEAASKHRLMKRSTSKAAHRQLLSDEQLTAAAVAWAGQSTHAVPAEETQPSQLPSTLADDAGPAGMPGFVGSSNEDAVHEQAVNQETVNKEPVNRDGEQHADSSSGNSAASDARTESMQGGAHAAKARHAAVKAARPGAREADSKRTLDKLTVSPSAKPRQKRPAILGSAVRPRSRPSPSALFRLFRAPSARRQRAGLDPKT
eukprot:358356-Chlamydomonas_euryale.AAC.3